MKMFLEVEDETRDFLTIYGKDFRPKRIERSKEYRPTSTYPPPLNVLNGPYEKCLKTRKQNLSLPLDKQSEDPKEYIERIRKKHPKLEKILPVILPDEDLIEREEGKSTKTVYQLHYSKDIYSHRKRKGPVSLPEGWIISETIQRKSYRNPWKIAAKSFLQVKKYGKPMDNLKPELKEREILRVRTGNSEYNDTIDVTGNRIIQDCLLGTPLSFEPQIQTKGPDSPQSECSQILTSEYLVLPSKIF